MREETIPATFSAFGKTQRGQWKTKPARITSQQKHERRTSLSSAKNCFLVRGYIIKALLGEPMHEWHKFSSNFVTTPTTNETNLRLGPKVCMALHGTSSPKRILSKALRRIWNQLWILNTSDHVTLSGPIVILVSDSSTAPRAKGLHQGFLSSGLHHPTTPVCQHVEQTTHHDAQNDQAQAKWTYKSRSNPSQMLLYDKG